MRFKSDLENICPVCNSNKLSYGAVENVGTMLYYPWECDDCHAHGEEWYSLDFNGHSVMKENGDLVEVSEYNNNDKESEDNGTILE